MSDCTNPYLETGYSLTDSGGRPIAVFDGRRFVRAAPGATVLPNEPLFGGKKRTFGKYNGRKLRLLIAERDGTACRWCGVETEEPERFTNGRLKDNHRTVDHVVPRSRGGSNDLSNVVIACYACNQKRGTESSSPPITESELVALLSPK